MTNHTEGKTAGVITPPPVLYGAALIVALALHWFWPLPIFRASVVRWLGIAVVALGLAVVLRVFRTMRAGGTNVDPRRPTTAIVTTGLFRFSRNPIYLGLTLMYLGLTLAFDTWWGLVLLVPLLLTMHRGVILREERYLEQTFGEQYRQYCSRVRRYL
jgi:protein-S-isoprenylcysteine O-methyltransferase Ste14